MAFTGMVVDAETALAWGLVSRVAAAPELLESAWSWRAASRPAREAVMAILERRSASFTGR
jgi:enoyl-CoA hydratase/carnithine racemase